MTIQFYDIDNELIYECDTLFTALHYAGELVDSDNDNITVIVADDDIIACAEEIDLHRFVKEYSPFTTKTVSENTVLNAERFHNLDTDEQREVLHYTTDGDLVAEVLRRLNEYHRTTDIIADALDNMKIYV